MAKIPQHHFIWALVHAMALFFSATMGTKTIDHQLHFDNGIILGQFGGSKLAVRQAKYLSTGHAMKMGMLLGMFLAPGAETPDPVIGGDAVGESNIHQPFQVAV